MRAASPLKRTTVQPSPRNRVQPSPRNRVVGSGRASPRARVFGGELSPRGRLRHDLSVTVSDDVAVDYRDHEIVDDMDPLDLDNARRPSLSKMKASKLGFVHPDDRDKVAVYSYPILALITGVLLTLLFAVPTCPGVPPHAPGQPVTITNDCTWLHAMITSNVHLQTSIQDVEDWERRRPHCGASGVIESVDVHKEWVKVRHANGDVIGWPIAATSVRPRLPPLSALALAPFHAKTDRLEMDLSQMHKYPVLDLLNQLGYTGYWKSMMREGLDRVSLIVRGTEADRKGAGITPEHWAVLKEAAASFHVDVKRRS